MKSRALTAINVTFGTKRLFAKVVC